MLCALAGASVAFVDHTRGDAADLDDSALFFTPRTRQQDTDASLQAHLALERIRQHLIAMDPKKAEALFLHDALGHDLAEIAVLTGVSVAAAQSRLVRARKELMSRLEVDGYGPPSSGASGR